MKRKLLVAVAVSISLFGLQSGRAQTSIDTEKSVMNVHVFKSGLFSAFGHEHEISAPIVQGSFVENPPRAEITVDARKMRVIDKDVSEKDRAEIQQTMLGPKVLDSERFPQIRFRSMQGSGGAQGKWILEGDLTLHGQTQPVRINVERREGRYRGTAELKQTDFGITPVTVGGGTVKVKNELRVEFEIVSRAQ
jgi:polyisoprenoid-binding protein YceI